MESVCFVNPDTGWAVSFRTILRTTDGGENWIRQFDHGYATFSSVNFINARTGWTVGGSSIDGLIYHTSDGGENWIPQISEFSENLESVCFADANTGWAVGYKGAILHSSDGGTNWSVPSTPFSERLTSVYLVNERVGWVVGYKGTILKIDMFEDTAVDGDYDVENGFSAQFARLHNYPNPFNASTTIHFRLHRAGDITLKVFDLIGRKIATLVDGKRGGGDHEVVWEAKDLPSGIYLLRMEAGFSMTDSKKRYAHTKKLILQK